VGRATLALDPVSVPGDVLAPASWKRATGSASLSAALVLDGADRLRQSGIPVPLAGRLRGHLAVDLTAERKLRTDPPTVAIDIAADDVGVLSRGQFLDLLTDSAAAQIAPSLGRLDARLALQLTPDGPSTADLEVTDAHGLIASAFASADVPYRKLWGDDLRILRTSPVLAWAGSMPIDAEIHAPERSLAHLPAVIDVAGMEGTIWATARLEGTIVDPHLSMKAVARRVRGGDLGLRVPMGADVTASWADGAGDVRAVLSTRRGGPFMRAHSHVEADLPAALDGADISDDWTAAGHVELCRFPLRPLNRIVDAQLRGWLTANLVVTGLNTDALSYELDLSGVDVMLGTHPYPTVEGHVKGTAKAVSARVRLEQEKGSADARLELPIGAHGVALNPDFAHASGRLDMSDFRLASLQPVVESVFDELDGRMDAHVVLKPGTQRLTGTARLREGRFQIASFGDTFFDTRADMRFENERLIVDDLEAKTYGGRATASARLKLTGLRPERAMVELEIKPDEAVPVIIDGQLYGDAHGKAKMVAHFEKKQLRASVDLNDFEVELTRTLPDSVQSLEPSPHVRIGTFVDGRFRTIALSPPKEKGRDEKAMPILVDLRLNDGVTVSRGSEIDIRLVGSPSIEITDRTRMRGEIRVAEGKIYIQGKPFTIERGVITFDGRPPDNPMVVTTAAWTAPDGTEVFADFKGAVQTGKVTLRSDPPLSKDAILSLILFGTQDAQLASTDNGNGGSASDTATSAAGVGGSILADGLNEAIRDLSNIDLSARVGTSQEGNTAAQLELQIARNLSLIYSYILGLPPPGQNPDRNYATIEWRFQHNWSLETSVGDQGSTNVDVLWKKRY
jgi:translocation and assembly module TamB